MHARDISTMSVSHPSQSRVTVSWPVSLNGEGHWNCCRHGPARTMEPILTEHRATRLAAARLHGSLTSSCSVHPGSRRKPTRQMEALAEPVINDAPQKCPEPLLGN